MKATPPLIQLMEGRRARPRKAFVLRPREVTLHLATADVLTRYCRPDWRWSHFPAGEARDVRIGAKLKRMGLQRGWPDFLLLDARGALHCLELKRAGEHLSEDQQKFKLWSITAGVPFAVARTMDDVQTIFATWRCLSISIVLRGGAE